MNSWNKFLNKKKGLGYNIQQLSYLYNQSGGKSYLGPTTSTNTVLDKLAKYLYE